jgi:hypothetical protein
MGFRMLRLAALLVPCVLLSNSCSKKESPAAPTAAAAASLSASSGTSGTKEAFPLPNGLAFNPLVDLGAEGRNADAAGSGHGTTKVKDEPARKAILKQAGAEPRNPLVYDFSTGKPVFLFATVKGSAREEAAGAPPQTSEQPPLRFTLGVSPSPLGKASSGRTPFVMNVANVEVVARSGAAIPKEVQEQLAQVASVLTKMTLGFNVDSHGALSELTVGGGEPAHPALAELVPLLQGATELLFALTPEEPIGLGAQWSSTSASPEVPGSLSSTYTLQERTESTAVVRVETASEMPASPVPDPRAPPGATMEMKAKGTYTLTLRLNGPAQKAVGDKEQRIVMKDPSAKPPQTMTSVVKMTQTVEAAPASAAAAKASRVSAPLDAKSASER